jgi:hypothetical protein
MWTIGSHSSAFLVHNAAGWNNDKIMERLFQHTIS